MLSASTAVFNSDAGAQDFQSLTEFGPEAGAAAETKTNADKGEAEVAGDARTVVEPETASDLETAQQRIVRLASAVLNNLRKGVDVGSVAAARAQAIRRYVLRH